jgi:hypothetical protein
VGGVLISPAVSGKVFGIGLSKTGTTSLTAALRILGYRSVHYPPLDRLGLILGGCDAATDTPVACSFRELDRRYRHSKFVLTVRNRDGWLASAEREFSGRRVSELWKREVRMRTYGVLEWDADTFCEAYDRHLEAVRTHFRDRHEALLVLDITRTPSWAPLCEFLGRPIPEQPFPHENRTER